MYDDPFIADRSPLMNYGRQTIAMAGFFDRYLKDAPAKPIASSVHYFVLGAGEWRDSAKWPPVNSTAVKWYPDGSGAFSTTEPAPAVERYRVDFKVTTGALSGYRGQVDLSQTDYGNRAMQDAHLLTFTSRPMTADSDFAGSPVAHLRLSTSAADGLVIVYLEDVAPGGRVTYITQGLLHLANRKLASADTGVSADPLHSYLRADTAPMVPGKAEDLAIAISPIAARIRKGHSLRLAIAGADDVNLQRIPAQGDETFVLESGPATYVEIPALR